MKKPESPTYVTRDEFDALVNTVGVVLAGAELAHRRAGYVDGTVDFQLARAEQEMKGSTERALLARIAKSFERAISAQRHAEIRRAAERGQAYQQISG